MKFENIGKLSVYNAGRAFFSKHLPCVMDQIPDGQHLRFEIAPSKLDLFLNGTSKYELSMSEKESPENIALSMVLLAGLRVEEMRRMHPVYRVLFDGLGEHKVMPVITRMDSGLQAVELIKKQNISEIIYPKFQEMQRRSGVVARCI